MVELCCPECGSKLLYRDGLRYLADGGTVQRWLCRNCGYRFSEKRTDLTSAKLAEVGFAKNVKDADSASLKDVLDYECPKREASHDNFSNTLENLPCAKLAQGGIKRTDLTCADSAQVDIKRNVDKIYQHLGRKSSKTSLNQASFSANAESQFSFGKNFPSDKCHKRSLNQSSFTANAVKQSSFGANAPSGNGKSFKNCLTYKLTDAHGKKALVMEVEKALSEKREAGATETTQQDVRGQLVKFLWHLKKNGYNPSTISVYNVWLQSLMKRGANLLDGESVKEVIASTSKWCENTKTNVILAYKLFADYLGLKWNPPRYGYVQRKLPFIPLENELDALIGGSGKKMATLLQLLKETGMRVGEAAKLRWRDIDFERMTVSVNTPEKNSNARIFKVSPKLIAMLNLLPKKTDKVFAGEPRGWRISFLKTRKRLSQKLQNPRLMQITFHTFRHWKATMEYHKTKNLLHVQQMLGHKNIQNTMIYTQLLEFEVEDEWHSATAKTIEEAKELIEAGFEYVCDIDGVKLFRKRK